MKILQLHHLKESEILEVQVAREDVVHEAGHHLLAAVPLQDVPRIVGIVFTHVLISELGLEVFAPRGENVLVRGDFSVAALDAGIVREHRIPEYLHHVS